MSGMSPLLLVDFEGVFGGIPRFTARYGMSRYVTHPHPTRKLQDSAGFAGEAVRHGLATPTAGTTEHNRLNRTQVGTRVGSRVGTSGHQGGQWGGHQGGQPVLSNPAFSEDPHPCDTARACRTQPVLRKSPLSEDPRPQPVLRKSPLSEDPRPCDMARACRTPSLRHGQGMSYLSSGGGAGCWVGRQRPAGARFAARRLGESLSAIEKPSLLFDTGG